jgi:hypothetical protein
MSVVSKVMHWVVCDRCGASPEWDDSKMVYDSEDEAVMMALDGDWYRVGDEKHACGNCVSWDDEGEAVLRPPLNPEPTGSGS